jgi:thiol-disulfide isomerase/thioredoxin
METGPGPGVLPLNFLEAVVGLLANPRKSATYFSEQPSLGSILPLFLMSIALLDHWVLFRSSVPLFPKLAILIPFLKNAHAAFPLMIGFTCGLVFFQAIFLHGTAVALGGRGRFASLCAVILVLTMIFQWTALLHGVWFWLGPCLWIWRVIIVIRVLSEIYALDTGSAVGVLVIGSVLEGLVLGGIVASTLVLRAASLKGKTRALPSASPTETLHRPADLNWVVQTLEGQNVPLQNFKGKVIVLNYWGTWCPPCRAEMPSLQRLADQFKGNDMVVVMSVSQERAKTVQKYLDKNHLTFPAYVRAARFPEGLDAQVYPTTYIISKHEGAREWDSPTMLAYLKKLASS